MARPTIGQHLRQARERSRLTVPQLVQRIREDHKRKIAVCTIRDAEGDKTPNPGIKTVETMALGLQLDVLETISLGLDSPPEFEKGFKASQFARLWKTYSKLDKQKQLFVDGYIEMLIAWIERWR